MNKSEIKNILLEEGLKESTIRSIFNGSRLLSMTKAIEMRDKRGIPLDYWASFKK